MRKLLMVAALALALPVQGPAGEATKVGDVVILDAWALAQHETSSSGSVYMTLETADGQADRLIGAATPAAEKAELRTYWLEGCFVHGHSVEAIEISPGRQTVLDPGGLHIMLTGLEQTLVEGSTIPLTLTFEQAGTVDIEVPVSARNRRAQSQDASRQAAIN